MWYLANPSTQRVRDAMLDHRNHLGLITTPKQGNRHVPGAKFGADNGCYGGGYPGEDKWWAWLGSLAPYAADCLFAVAPDVFDPVAGKGDAVATLERSAPWLPRIRALGMPAALVAQDGLEDLDVPWDTFDVLFIGGSTEWKLGPHAARLIREAKIHGKFVHMGRVNSRERLLGAHLRGCDTADGTYIAFGPDVNLPDVLAWLREVNDQADLFGDAA